MFDYYVHQTVSAFLSVILCLESIVKFQVSLSFVKLKIYKFTAVSLCRNLDVNRVEFRGENANIIDLPGKYCLENQNFPSKVY